MTDKISEIEELAGNVKSNIPRLLELTEDADEEVRFRAVEAFHNLHPSDAVLQRIRECLGDEDELVRTECIELLGEWRDLESTEALYASLNDKSELVRTAASISIGQIGRKDSARLLEHQFEVSGSTEKASVAIALYILGNSEYLDKALKLLSDENYVTRCAVANLVCDFVDDKDIQRVVPILKKALLKEGTRAATSSLRSAISCLEA